MWKVTDKGQITIPKEIRDLMGIKCGDWVDIVAEDGQMVIYLLDVSVKKRTIVS